MRRVEALKEYAKSYHGQRLCDRLTESEFDEVVAFIDDNEDLDHLQFEYAVNRFYLDQPKPKNFPVMQEILSSVNTRAKGTGPRHRTA